MSRPHLYILLFVTILASCGGMPERYGSPYSRSNDTTEGGLNKNSAVQFRSIDAGQGDATLITTPNGKTILIDAGTKEMARARVVPLLAGIRPELIIASHYDTDHAGGISEVLKGPDEIIGTADDIVPERGILDRGNKDMIDTAELSDYFIIASALRYSLETGNDFTIDGVNFSILGQNGTFMNGTDGAIDPQNENAHSISLLITYGKISYLTSGDLPGPDFPNQYEPSDLESHISKLAGNVDILHTSHHGSHNSTNAAFVQAIDPKIAVISVGENDYGHPSPAVLKTLTDAGTAVYLTEGDWIENKDGLNIIDGDICMETDGKNILAGKC